MKNFKLLGLINPFDVLIVAMVVLLVWWLNQFAAPQHVAADGGVLVRYTIELHDRPDGFHRDVETGRALVDGTRGLHIGTIIEVYATPFYQDAPDEAAGVFRRAKVPNREITNIVVEAWADITDYAILIGQFQLRSGASIMARSFSFAGEAFVGAIEFPTGGFNDR